MEFVTDWGGGGITARVAGGMMTPSSLDQLGAWPDRGEVTHPAKARRSVRDTALADSITGAIVPKAGLDSSGFKVIPPRRRRGWPSPRSGDEACPSVHPPPYSGGLVGKACFFLRIVVAITGASGTLYAQRLLDNLDAARHEVHLVMSRYASAVMAEELSEGLRVPTGVTTHNLKSMNAPFASGSSAADAMVIVPCSMGTLGRIAHGFSEDLLLRAADVVLKEKKKLILVPRETPLNLVHIKNFELLTLAGATILPANPSFYSLPKSLEEVVDTVVARILDHLGLEHKLGARWGEERD